MGKKKNPFDNKPYTYREFRWELFKQKFEAAYETIGTPSFLALVIYVSIVILLSLSAFYFDVIWLYGEQIIQLVMWQLHSIAGKASEISSELKPMFAYGDIQNANREYSDISYIPTIIAGIATFGFALLFFVAEFVKDKGSHPYTRTIIQKTLIFPLVISAITSFMVLVFFPKHPYVLGVLAIYLGAMALVATYYLFRWIWTKNEVQEGGGIPAVQAIYRLFLHEINTQNGFGLLKKRRERKAQRIREKTEQSIHEFIDGLLTYQSPRDDEYMMYLGRMLVRIRYILNDNDFIDNNSTVVPELLAPYLQKLLFHDAEITKLIRKDKIWIRRAAYLSITNAELALEVGNENAMSRCLTMVTALYGVLHEKKQLRDDFLDMITRWMNEFSAYYAEPKLFEIPSNITEYRDIVRLSEVVFNAYSGLIYNTYDSGITEGSDKNHKEVLSAFSRVYDDYLRGGFSAKRNIERDAEAADFWLKHPENTEKTPREYKLDIEINEVRKELELNKRGMLACLGAIFFHEMYGWRKDDKEKIQPYYEGIFSRLVISVESLIPLFLNFPKELDDRFGLDSYLRRQWTYTEKPQVHAVPNIVYDLLPGALLNILLMRKDVEVPETLEPFVVQGRHAYPAEKLIELLEKILSDNSPVWSNKLPRGYKKKTQQLIALLQNVKSVADEKKKEEIRIAPILPNAEEIFKKGVIQGFSGKSNCLRIFKKCGLVINNKCSVQYEGKVQRKGITQWHEKGSMMEESSLEHAGKIYGENMSKEEGRIFLTKLMKKLTKEEISIATLIRRIGSLESKDTLIVTNHFYWFDTLLNSKAFSKFVAMPEKNDVNFKNYGDIFRGYLVIRSKKYPVIGLHERVLERHIITLNKTEIGELNYFSAESHGESLKDSSTTPLYVNLIQFLDDKNTKKLAKRKTILTNVSIGEEKAKRLQELVSTQVLFRFDVEPNQDAISVYKLRLRGRIVRRKQRRKKRKK